jgi:hypothetical protein
VLSVGPSRNDDVLELQIAVRNPAIVERREGIENRAEHCPSIAKAQRPVAPDARRERLAFGIFVRDVVRSAVGQLPHREILRQRRVPEPRDEARHREKAIERARIARRFATENLEDDLLAVLIGAIDDPLAPFAEPMRDEEWTDLYSALQRLVGGKAALTQIAQPRIGVRSRTNDRLDERVESIHLRAPFSQRSSKRGFGLGPTDLFRIESQEVPAQSRKFIEAKKTLDFPAKNLDIHTRSLGCLDWILLAHKVV